jgi:hypothetical protein
LRVSEISGKKAEIKGLWGWNFGIREIEYFDKEHFYFRRADRFFAWWAKRHVEMATVARRDRAGPHHPRDSRL